MKKNLIILFLVLLTIVNVAALATIAYHRFQPKGHFPPEGRPPDMHKDFIQQELGLNEKQAKEFRAHFERGRKETEPILDSIEVKRMALMDELSANEPDKDRLNRLAEEIGSLQAELQKKMIVHLLEGKSLLTPEQQKKLFSLFKEVRGREGEFRGPGGMPGPPGKPDFGDGR
jgi:Spy/CpxP family protein refolding chaperone